MKRIVSLARSPTLHMSAWFECTATSGADSGWPNAANGGPVRLSIVTRHVFGFSAAALAGTASITSTVTARINLNLIELPFGSSGHRRYFVAGRRSSEVAGDEFDSVRRSLIPQPT